MATGTCVLAVSSLTPERSIGAILERKNNIYNSFLWYDWNIKACNIKSILWDLITYRCSKLVDYLLRVEQKIRSHPHKFQGRCWDGIRFLFHTCKLLFRQSFHNGWSELTPGIAAFFLRCTLEIRFWHIYKCKGVETLFWDHDILSNKYKFSLPLAHTPHRSGQVFTTMGSLQLGFAFSQNSSLSQHVTVIISIGKTKTAGNIIMDIIIFRNFIGSIFFPKITVTYFACLLACRLDEIQGAIYTVAAPLLCIITLFRLPFYPMDEGKKIWVKCLSSVLYGFFVLQNAIRCVFQHYQNEYDVPVTVELKAVVLGTLDVSSVRVRLRPKNVINMYSI